jgi:phenylalanyl-tRNA synthetase beta chain
VYASLNWLGDFLGRRLDLRETADRLTMLGAAVEGIEPLYPGLDHVVVGLVEQVERHPDADRLSVCRVNAGNGLVEVVCGAPNVTAGVKYPFAPAGAVLPGGLKLERRKIRGVVSNGMLCSARELGLGSEGEGILPLQTDAPPGTPLLDVLPSADTRLEIDVTANRPDLLGQRGVARELAGAYGIPLRLPPFPGGGAAAQAPRRVGTGGTVGGVAVSIEDVEGCPRYIAAVIRGVRVGPSPEWLQARLRSVGARAINNVVDATNYVLHEINQPMHAFDLARLRGGKLVIRRAVAGEQLTTLDGARRTLTPDMTMICDAEGPVAVAGVMGGANSEVSGATTDLLLECAYFDPARVRKARTRLKLTTDASYRYERGTDLLGLGQSVRRAIELILTVAGGAEAEAALDLWPRPESPRTVFLRPERVAHLLGVSVPRPDLERLLTGVGFTVAPKDERLAVQVPGWRPDVTREVDLIEEVARLRGYDSFPVEFRPFRPTEVPSARSEKIVARVRRLLTGLGLHEARTLSLGPAYGPEAPELQNPLSADESHLRTALLPGLIRSVEYNWSLKQRDIRLFEVGHVFRSTGPGRLPEETLRVAAVLTGARRPPHWSEGGKPGDLDLWDLRHMLGEVARVGGPPGARLAVAGDGWELRDGEGTVRGWARPLRADAPPWAAPLLGLEVDLADVERPVVRYRALPATPAVERDLALVLPEGVVAGVVEESMRRAAGPLLETAWVFDEYRGSGLAGRSVAWRLVFRDPLRTLRDEEVDAAVARVLDTLRSEFGIERR